MKLHFEKLIKSILQEAVTYDQLINYISNNVKEVDVEQYGQRIWNAYQDESNTKGRQMTPKEFVEDMYDTIGWDWVNEEEIPSSSTLDPRKMIASVGYSYDEGILTTPYDFSSMSEEEVREYISNVSFEGSETLKPVEFKTGATAIMNFARESEEIEDEELQQLKQALIKLRNENKNRTFFLYGIAEEATDLSLGVI